MLLMALNVALSGNDCVKSLPSSMLALRRGSKGTEPEMKRRLTEPIGGATYFHIITQLKIKCVREY